MSEDCNHHRRQEYCTTRLKYRQGRELKAVKVYTVANESQHLLVFGVPKINLQQELKRSLGRFGTVSLVKSVTNDYVQKVELEMFTDVYHVTFSKIENARRAKRYLDAKEFYGGILHISYAPELESLEQLRTKLTQRKTEVNTRIIVNAKKEKLLVQSNAKIGHS